MRRDFIPVLLSRLFSKYGGFVGRYPWPFLLIPPVISLALGTGILFMETTSDLEYLYIPRQAPGLEERSRVEKLFPFDEAENFSPIRNTRNQGYAQVLLRNKDGGNVLTDEQISEVFEIDAWLQNKGIRSSGWELTYRDVCSKWQERCIPNDFLVLMTNRSIDNVSISFPIHTLRFGKLLLSQQIGSVELDDNDYVTSAKAILLSYYTRYDTKSYEKASEKWLNKVRDKLLSYESKHFTIYFQTSLSISQEFENSVTEVFFLFFVTFSLLSMFAVLSTMMTDCVLSKPWVALAGLVSAGLASLSSLGLLTACGVPFTSPVAIVPFLVIGIGLDDMYILVSAWRYTCCARAVHVRLAHALQDAAVSITITSLTDALAFGIGTISTFRSVQLFCAYAMVGVLFCYVYQLTFTLACMTFSGRRERANRHCATFRKIPTRKETEGRSLLYKWFCTGGIRAEYVDTQLDSNTTCTTLDNLSAASNHTSMHDQGSVNNHTGTLDCSASNNHTCSNNHKTIENNTASEMNNHVVGNNHTIEVVPNIPKSNNHISLNNYTIMNSHIPVKTHTAMNGHHPALNKITSPCTGYDNTLSNVNKNGTNKGSPTGSCAQSVASLRSYKSTNTSKEKRERSMDSGSDNSPVYIKLPWLNSFLSSGFATVLMSTPVRVLCIMMYMAYLAVCGYGMIYHLEEGFDLANLVPDDSYYADFVHQYGKHFATEYGPVIQIIYDEPLDYTSERVRDEIRYIRHKYKRSKYFFRKSDYFISWLEDYSLFLDRYHGVNSLDMTLPEFITILRDNFLTTPGLDRYKSDIIFNANFTKIKASREFIQSKGFETTYEQSHIMAEAREIAKESEFNMFSFFIFFPYFDQFTVIASNTIQSLGIAVASMFVVSLVLIPSLSTVILVTLTTVSIEIGVIGFMALWDVSLDSVSMINLIMCIGFSVDFAAHISYHYVSSRKSDPTENARDALGHLGAPIIHAALSTIISVAILALSKSYIFRTFFKIVMLIMLFGFFHAIFLLPVILSSLKGLCNSKHTSSDNKSHVEDQYSISNGQYSPQEKSDAVL